MCNKDLEGKTIAELRSINAKLNSDRTAASHALAIEKTERINEFNARKEQLELEYESSKAEAVAAYNVEKALLDKQYCEYGIEVGCLRDKRRLAEHDFEVDSYDDAIKVRMTWRHEIKVKKAAKLAQLQKELLQLKADHAKKKRELALEREHYEQDFKRRRMEMLEQFDEAMTSTRSAVAALIREYNCQEE